MTDQTPGMGHNLKGLSEAMKSAFAKRWKIEQEIIESTEDLKADKKKVWAGLKTDTGMETKDLQLHYRLFARDMEAKSFEEEDRIRIQDNQRALFEAMAMGMTLSFMDVLARVGGNAPKQRTPVKPKGKSADKKTIAPSDAYQEGLKAGKSAKGSPDDNPFDEGTDSHKGWLNGWGKGQAENMAKLESADA